MKEIITENIEKKVDNANNKKDDRFSSRALFDTFVRAKEREKALEKALNKTNSNLEK